MKQSVITHKFQRRKKWIHKDIQLIQEKSIK